VTADTVDLDQGFTTNRSLFTDRPRTVLNSKGKGGVKYVKKFNFLQPH